MIRRHLTAALAALGALVAPLAASSQIAVSQLPAATALAGTEVTPVVQSGTTKKATADQLATRAITVLTGQVNTFTARQTINKSGGATIPAAMDDAALQVVGAASAANVVHTDTFAAQGGGFVVRRANGTPAAPTAVLNHHVFGLFGGVGYDGTAWGTSPASYMSSSPGEDWSPGNHGAQLNFVTTPNGSTTAVSRWSVYNDGVLSPRGDALYDLGSTIERVRFGYIVSVDLREDGNLGFNGRSQVRSPADSNLLLTNAAANDFSLLIFGQAAVGFPALKRSGNVLQFRLGNDSGYASTRAAVYFGASGSRLFDQSDGVWTLTDNAGTSVSMLQFGGPTVGFPALKRSGQELQAKLADDSNDAPVTTLTVRTKSQTLAQLNTAVTSAAAAGAGTRAFINDANTTLILGIGTVAVGGGANKVPVYSDGTNWIIG